MRAGNPPWEAVLLVAAVSVLAVGCVAWVFPGPSASIGGIWLLPALSIAGLALALWLSAGWFWLRGLLAVLAVTLIVGWMKAPYLAHSTSHFAGASFGLLVMLIVGRLACTQQRLRWAMFAILSAGLFVLVLGLAGSERSGFPPFVSFLVSKVPAVRLGLQGLGSAGVVNPNALAAAALLVVPFGVSVLLFRSHEKIDRFGLQPLGLVVLAAGLVTLAASHSRSGLMAVWLTLAAVLVRGLRSWVWRLLIGTLVMALPFLVVVSTYASSRDEFLLRASLLWRTVGDRIHIMDAGVDRWKESPWFGIGMNRFRTVYSPPAVMARADPGDTRLMAPPVHEVAHAHNVFLQTALDVGAIGLGAYCGMLGFLLVRADQTARGRGGLNRAAAVGGGLSLVAACMFGVADAVTLGAKVGLFQWLAGGLILAAWRREFELVRKAG
jgi:hypothetical protein